MNAALADIGTSQASVSLDPRDFSHQVGQLPRLLAKALRDVDCVLNDALTARDEQTQGVLDFVKRLSGKKMRPTLTILSHLASRNLNAQNRGPNSITSSSDLIEEVPKETIRLAAVVELVHLATLVHDDVLDHAALRRHLPTIHTQWDTTTAILIGDWLFTKAYQLANMGESTLPGRWIAESACRLCEGEIFQNRRATHWELAFDDYHQMLKGKTGELCAVSCRLGAWSAGADEHIQGELADFGMSLGVAFQLHDDYLDYWGTASTGKPLFADLKSNKATLPIIQLLESVSQTERPLVLADLALGFPENQVRIQRWLELYRIQHTTQFLASDFSERAVSHLDSLLDSPAKVALGEIAKLAVERKS